MTSTAVDPTETDRIAIGSIPQQITAAWAEHDGVAFAEVFTDDAVMILPGVLVRGRDGIRDFMTNAFSGPYKGTQVTGTPVDMRFLGSDAAVVVTRGGVLEAGAEAVAEDRAVNATWVVTRKDGTWKLASYQNGPAAG